MSILNLAYELKIQYSHTRVAASCAHICVWAITKISSHVTHMRLISICPVTDPLGIEQSACFTASQEETTSLYLLFQSNSKLSQWIQFKNRKWVMDIDTYNYAEHSIGSLLLNTKQSAVLYETPVMALGYSILFYRSVKHGLWLLLIYFKLPERQTHSMKDLLLDNSWGGPEG